MKVCFIFHKKSLAKYPYSGLPRSGKKFWKMKNFPGQGKVRELHLQSGKFKKMKKVMEKLGNFKIFLKRMLVKQASGNFSFHNLQAILEKEAIYVQKYSFSNIYGLRFFFKDKISKFKYLCKRFE